MQRRSRELAWPPVTGKSEYFRKKAPSESFCISFFGCTLLTACFLGSDPQVVHLVCHFLFYFGALIGADAVDWLRGKCNLFDPAGICRRVRVHLFLLHSLLTFVGGFGLATTPKEILHRIGATGLATWGF